MSQHVVITGARSGVALRLAERLRARGCRLALISREPPAAEDDVVQADVTDPAQAAGAFADVLAMQGRPADGFVHCVGSTLIASIERTSAEQFREVFRINVDSAFHCIKAYVAQLKAAGQPGSIVLYSSVVAGIGVQNHVAIAAAKGAIEAMVRSLAADLSGAGIRINAIAPGLMRSPMTARMVASEAAAKQISAQYPLGRHGDAADGAAAADFLLSADSGWITGQILHLDGGFSAVRPYVRV